MIQQVCDETQIRRVQTPDDYSFTFYFPKTFARALEIHKEDFLKCQIQDNKLVVEKLSYKGLINREMTPEDLANSATKIIEEIGYTNLL